MVREFAKDQCDQFAFRLTRTHQALTDGTAGVPEPQHAEQAPAPKKVVYLWGAGATQAEVSYLGAANINILMRDYDELGVGVATRILGKLPAKWHPATPDEGMDIEKLISLLAGSGVDEYSKLAERIRELYFEDIRDRLTEAKVLTNPQLAIALLNLHQNQELNKHELLSGIITTNHDGLLQVAAQRVHGAVNIGVPFESLDLKFNLNGIVPLLHLHGSFTWLFGLPLRVSSLHQGSAYSPKTTWIPPTILKESKNYPFNKLSGLAYELLSKHCDVLRVVGSSLTQNDWNVLSMIFNAQRHMEFTNAPAFKVELIMSHRGGIGISGSCSYLKNLTPIGYLTDGEFADYKEDKPLTIDMKNPLYYWLKQKIQFHQRRGELGGDQLDTSLAKIAGDTP